MSEPVTVRILGEEYTISSEAPADYTRRVAEFFDKVVQETQRETGVLDPPRIAILAALSVTDHLFRAREAEERLRRAVEKRGQALAAEITAVLDSRPAA